MAKRTGLWSGFPKLRTLRPAGINDERFNDVFEELKSGKPEQRKRVLFWFLNKANVCLGDAPFTPIRCEQPIYSQVLQYIPEIVNEGEDAHLWDALRMRAGLVHKPGSTVLRTFREHGDAMGEYMFLRHVKPVVLRR